MNQFQGQPGHNYQQQPPQGGGQPGSQSPYQAQTPQQQYQQQNPAPAVGKKDPVICITQGRIIFTSQDGDLFKGAQKKNMKTGELMFDAKSGLPIWEWVVGLSVPKIAMQQDPNGIGRIWTEMWAEFLRKFPNGMSLVNPATGFPDPKATFSLKCIDGDLAVDERGAPKNGREGYKGCYVLTLSTRIPPQFFIPQGGQNVLVTSGIKVGDIVNACVQLSSGDSGLYLNPKMIQLVEAGAPIVSGPSADSVFGMNQPQRSQYIQSVPDPMANPATAFGNQGQYQQPAGMPPQQQYQPQGGQPPYQAPAQAAPNYGALPQQYQQPAGMPPQQQYQPQGGQYDPNAGVAGPQQPPAQYAGGNPSQQPGYASPVGQPPYGNGGMPPQGR